MKEIKILAREWNLAEILMKNKIVNNKTQFTKLRKTQLIEYLINLFLTFSNEDKKRFLRKLEEQKEDEIKIYKNIKRNKKESENNLNYLLKCFINPIYTWIEPENRTIAELIYLTAARTRRARQNRMEINEEVLYDEEFRRGFMYVFPGKNIEEEIEDMRWIFQFSVMFDVNTMVANPKAAQMIDKMTNFDYFIFRNDSSTEYYTSDHPIVNFDMSDEEGYKVVFSLTPKWCLVLYNSQKLMDDYPTQIIIASEEFVKGVNEAMVQVSHKYVYSRTNDFNFVKSFLETISSEV